MYSYYFFYEKVMSENRPSKLLIDPKQPVMRIYAYCMYMSFTTINTRSTEEYFILRYTRKMTVAIGSTVYPMYIGEGYAKVKREADLYDGMYADLLLTK